MCIDVYIYMIVCIKMYVCVCVCVCVYIYLKFYVPIRIINLKKIEIKKKPTMTLPVNPKCNVV